MRLLGLGEERVRNISAASDPGFFSPPETASLTDDERAELERLGIDRRFIFCVASNDDRKNLRGLLDAYPRLPPMLRFSHQLVVSCYLRDEDKLAIRTTAEERRFAHRLVLTGEVSDETLRMLYRRCAAFVFPSTYEGFGLPLLEAMLCGAPVVAGNNSSQPEVVGDAAALVDVKDPANLAGAIEGVLANPATAAHLRERGTVQASRFTWTRTADETLDAIRTATEKRIGRTARRPTSRRRRVALFSPFPPKTSGISDYAARLATHLSRHFDVDLYHDRGYVPTIGLESGPFACFDERLFERNAAARDYAGVLYQMGNSLYHGYLYRALLKRPGIVTLHDYGLAGFYWGETHRLGRDTRELREEMLRQHPDAEGLLPADWHEWLAEPGEFAGACARRGLWMNRRVFETASAVVVHSRWCVDRVALDLPDSLDRTVHIPYGADVVETGSRRRAALREEFGIAAEATVIGSLGILHSSKMNVETVVAFARIVPQIPTARLVFVGPDLGDGEARRTAEELGVADRVRFYGAQPADRLVDFAGVFDLGINLRRPPTNGETSAALLDLLRAGVPTVVTATATFADYPDRVVRKLEWSDAGGTERLANECLSLLRDRAARERLGREAHRYVREQHGWPAAADRYAALIDRMDGRRAAG